MSDEVVIPVIAMTIPIVVVPTALFFKHLGRKREYEHKERMRAIEMGYTGPSAHSLLWPSLAALGIGAGVPIFATLFAFLTALTGTEREEVWMSAMLVGVAGVISGAVFGTKMLGLRQQGAPMSPPTEDYAKPAFDPDAYDTVGRRG